MKVFIRFKLLLSSSIQKRQSMVSILNFSSLSKASKILQTRKNQQNVRKAEAETSSFVSLFNEITHILGADTLTPEKSSSAVLMSNENHTVSITGKTLEFSSCTQTVCRNAEEGLVREAEDNLVGKLVEVDVSPVVNEITEIVRAENHVISMEESLENANFHFEPEIVEKVLKRCFKVPKLAVRFFNWLKLKHDFCPTTEIYNTMLYIVGEARDFRLLENLVKEMEENSCHKDVKTWTILISHYGKAKMINKALVAFEDMIKSGCESDSAAYKMMIRSLCNAGKGELATEFYKEMIEKEFVLDFTTYKMLLNAIARTENSDILVLQSVANDMVNISHIPQHKVYGCLLQSFCVAGRIKEALELIRDLKDKEVSLDRDYFMILVKGLCKTDMIADALEIVDILKTRNSVDGKVYEIIINGYLRRNDVSKALKLFESMKESGHLPTASTYTELMQRLFRLDEYRKSCDLYEEMIKKGVKPDSVTVAAIVAGHVRQNLVDEAWKVFKSMKDIGVRPNWKAYSVFIKELCRVYKTEEIIKVLHLMQASKIVIGDEIFNWVLSCLERKGEVDKIREVKQIQASSYDSSREEKLHVELSHDEPEQIRPVAPPQSTTFNELDVRKICRVLWSSEDWCTVQQSLENCNTQFKPELVVEILKKSMMHGNAALRFFSWVGMQAGYKHTTETYNMAIKLSGRGKDFKSMRRFFHDMRRGGLSITPDTWAIMIMQYGRAGLTDIALRTYGEMKVSGFNPTSGAFKCLILVLCERKHRKADESVKIFQEMLRAGYIPDKKLVETYLDCLCEVGMLFEARSCVDSLGKVGFAAPLTHSMYIRALCRAGRLEEALLVTDKVRNKQFELSKLDRYTYGSLVHGLLQRGRVKEAMAKVDSMKEVGINPTVHVYTSLIVHFFKEKQSGKALETFEKMREEGCEPTVVTYSALICGYMNMGMVDDAWNSFDVMKTKGCSPDFKMYSVFISCLCEAGKSEDALKLLYEMMDSGIAPSSVNFRTVFYGLNREGKQKLAQTVLQQKSYLKRRRQLST